MPLSMIPMWAWGVLAVLVLVSVFYYFKEGSAQKASRAAQRSSKQAAYFGGSIALGTLAGVAGLGQGLAGGLSGIGDILFAHPGTLGQLGIAALGYFVVNGQVDLGATGFALAALAVMVLVIMGRR